MLNNNSDNTARLAKNTFLLYIRQFFVLAMSLYTSRLTLQVLGETDFGIYAAVGGITALLSVITSSLASGTQRFMTFELGAGNTMRLSSVYCTSLQIHFTLCLLLLLIGETAGTWFIFNKMSIPHERLWTAFYVFQFTLASSMMSLTNVPNSASIIAHEDMGIYALFSILDAVLKLSFVTLLFIISSDKLVAYAFFLFLLQFISRCISEVWCRRKYQECHYHFVWDKSLLKDMLGLSGWAGLSTLAVSVFIQGVNVLLNVFFGPVMNAAYSVAMQAYSGIRSFCSSFQLAANPQIVKSYSAGNLERMRTLLFSVCRMSFFLIFLLSLPFLLNAHYVLALWLKDVPEHAESFFCLLVVYAYLDVLAYPLDISAQATGQLKLYSTLTSIGVFFILPITYVCYIMGAVAETVYVVAIVMSFVNLLIRLYCLDRLIGIGLRKFLKEVVMRMILVAICASLPPYLIKITLNEDFVTVSSVFVLSIFSSSLVIFLGGMNKSERTFTTNYLKKFKHKLSLQGYCA